MRPLHLLGAGLLLACTAESEGEPLPQTGSTSVADSLGSEEVGDGFGETDGTTGSPAPGDDGTAGADGITDSSGGAPPADGTDDTSGGPPGLSPRVTWGELLDAAASEAAAINPNADLSLIAARGVLPDGTVDLSDTETDGLVEFRFWQEGADTGVSVIYGVDAYSVGGDALMPAAYPVNGNAYESPLLWDVATLPSFAEVAAGFGATANCDAFSGHADDRISMRVDWFTEAYIEVSAGTANGSSTADAATLAFGDCM
ncbi:MAG: hypothetical protein AAF721_01805 [Myxococcota bacterium]